MDVSRITGRSTGLFACLVLTLGATAQVELPDPVQGRFRVDPKGQGPDVFRDFSTAVRYLSMIGVSGPLELVVAPGSYEGKLQFFPVPGQTSGQKIVIRSAVPGAARLSAVDSPILELIDATHDLVFDGFTFEAHGQSSTVLMRGASKDIEIRNCRFTRSQGGGAKVIEVQGQRKASGIEIHHNKFELKGCSYGIYTQGTTQLMVHHNDFLCLDVGEPVSIWNSNKSESAVYHNVFRGRTSRTCVRLNVSGHDVDVHNNLFLLEQRAGQVAIGSRGLGNARWNRIYHNLFILLGEGLVLESKGPIEVNNNSYAVQGDGIGKVENVTYDSLEEWREALVDVVMIEQADQGSLLAEQDFFDKHPRLIKIFHDFEVHEALDAEVAGEAEEEEAGAVVEEPPHVQDPAAARAARRAHLDYLIGLLDSADPVVLRLAIRGLRELGRSASPAVAGLGRMCNHPHAPVRAEAVAALGEIRTGAEIVIPELLRLLSEEDVYVVLPTIGTLQSFAHLARQAEPDLRLLEKHSDARVSEAAKAALAIILKQD